MPTIKRFFSSLKFIPRSRLLLMTGTSIVSVLMLGYYLHQTGNLPLPLALGRLLSSPSKVEQRHEEDSSVPIAARRRVSQPDFFPGVRLPPMRAAAEAGLADDSEVIGIRVGGQARAYRIAALSGGPEFHLVNDVLGGRPVSVAYCDRTRCVRVFTEPAGNHPLELGFVGWVEGIGPILQMAGVKYTLEDGKNLTQPQGPPLPYPRLQYERTTWGEWRRSHPDTDVYVIPPPLLK
jgi:hypothetical protein